MALSRRAAPEATSPSPLAKLVRTSFERGMALLVLVNFGLVGFDLSYIRFRDFYLTHAPEFTEWYGENFKGIEPERATVAYLETVEDLEREVAQSGLTAPSTQAILEDLRTQSSDLVDENPFQVANKSGTLERIKNMMRDRTGLDSAKDSFDRFWSVSFLAQQGWNQELRFFQEEVQPLMETNYFRPIGENGAPLDEFWRIDIWFIALFAAEFLLRTLYLSRRYKGTNWFDAMVWRWYDLLLFLPFWRWLRIIPTIVRTNQSNLINFEPVRHRITRIFITHLAVELTEVVFLRIIEQAQNLIRQGEASQWLLDLGQKRYINLSGRDEIQVIGQRLVGIVAYDVIPQIKPELDALIKHSITNGMAQSSAYQQIQQLPGIGDLPDRLAQQVSGQVTRNLYGILKNLLEDERGGELTRELTDRFVATLRTELRQEHVLEELEDLTHVFLEEVKVNYVKRLAEEDIDKLMEQTYHLYEVIQHGEETASS